MDISQLANICELIYDTFKTPAFLLNDQEKVIFKTSPPFIPNPFYKSMDELFQKMSQLDDVYDYPIILTSNHLENYILLPIHDEEMFIATIVVGPSLYTSFSDHHIESLISDQEFSAKREVIIDYYKNLPILENIKLLDVSRLIYFMVYTKKLEASFIIQQNTSINTKPLDTNLTEVYVSEQKKNFAFHSNRIEEKKFLQLVSEGRQNRLLEYTIVTNKSRFGILSRKSYMRSSKNLAIVAITLVSRAAMDGGLNSEVAYNLSDIYIQQIEELTTVEEIRKLVMDIICDFTGRVKRSKNGNFSKPVTLCQNYIMDHIYEPITLSQLSSVVNLNKTYLSALIKKEMGISFSEYLQLEKVKEAQKLLDLTDYSISEICTFLHFNDQSYFSKVFKKVTGITPRQYRDKKCSSSKTNSNTTHS